MNSLSCSRANRRPAPTPRFLDLPDWLIYILTWVRTGMEKDAPSLVTLQEDLMALHKLIVNEIITKDEFKTLRRNALEPYGIQPKD